MLPEFGAIVSNLKLSHKFFCEEEFAVLDDAGFEAFEYNLEKTEEAIKAVESREERELAAALALCQELLDSLWNQSVGPDFLTKLERVERQFTGISAP